MDAIMGARLLGEIEETSLEEVLQGLRPTLDPAATNTTLPKQLKRTHLQPLDHLSIRHFRATQTAAISVSGRHLPLLYTIVSSLVSPPHSYALIVFDLEGHFDVTRLTCTLDDLCHLYIRHPARSTSPDHLRTFIAEAEAVLMYSSKYNTSAARSWWGTVVVGGLGAGDIIAGWRGWLRVEREQVRGFPPGMSAEEALGQRLRRQEAVDAAGWAATSQWGRFVFHEEKEGEERDTIEDQEDDMR